MWEDGAGLEKQITSFFVCLNLLPVSDFLFVCVCNCACAILLGCSLVLFILFQITNGVSSLFGREVLGFGKIDH